MDGGEWVDEVSEESDADQQRARGGGGEERLGSRGEGILASNPSTGPQQKPAVTHPALPGSNRSFITSNKIALTHRLHSIFVSFLPPELSQVVSSSRSCSLMHSSLLFFFIINPPNLTNVLDHT